MEITRRDFGRLAGSACVAGLAPAVSPQEGEWRAGNDSLVQVVRLEAGRFFCASLRDLGAGREWIHPALPSLEFRIDLTAGGREVQLTGAGPFRAARAETREANGWRTLKIELDQPPFTVIREYVAHERLPVLRTRTSVRNDGGDTATLRRIDSLSIRVAPSPEPLDLYWINNFCRAMLPVPGNPIHRCSMTENVRQVLRTGPYSPDFGWFSLMTTEGESLVGGWEWSGPMAVAFGDLVDPCPIEGGLDPEGMHEELAPGATFQAPMAWYGFSRGLDEQAELSHKLVRTALGPPLPERGFPWIAYCTWSSSFLDIKNPYNEPGTHPWFPTERNLLSQVDAAAGLGCELFLWDFGWFPHIGDWWCDPRRFPNGPRTVARAVKQRGMKLGLWLGFGNADDISAVVRQHPDWLASYGGRPIPDRFFTRTAALVWNTRALCLAHRPAREWVKEQLARVIESFELDWLKHDFDIITICDSTEHTHTRGDSRIASCEAFYEVMDFIRQKYPALVCENWVNNSGVPDYGALQRNHVQLIGDTYAAFVLRQMFYGHLLVFPPDRQQRYVRFEDSAGDLKTMLRSGFLGGPCTLLSDPRLLPPDGRAVLAGEIERYKRWRNLFATGRVYSLLGRAHPRSWDATEFYDASAGRGLVFVFRNDTAAAARTFPLRGLDAAARYRIEMIDAGETRVAAGGELMGTGLTVRIPERNRSDMILLTRVES